VIVWYPIYEDLISYVPELILEIVYSPLISVAAPNDVPTTIMLAPISGSPLVRSVTFPLSFPVCATAISVGSSSRENKKVNHLFILSLLD
jgi:hypothetical protein